MREIREEERLGPSTGCIVEEAVSRGIPFIRLNKGSLVQLGYGLNQKRIRAIPLKGSKLQTVNYNYVPLLLARRWRIFGGFLSRNSST